MFTAKLNKNSLRHISNNLDELIDKAARGGSRDAIKKASRPLVKEAKLNIKSHGEQSGFLRKSIKAKVKTYKKSNIVMSFIGPDSSVKGTFKRKNDKFPTKVWPVTYAHLVEFGFIHAKNKRFVPAKPFLRPAFDSQNKKSFNIYQKEIKQSIKKVGARLNKKVKFS